jgi:hypothetical protein
MRWIHDLDALRALSRHDDPNVRRWAVSRWMARHPRTDLVGLGRLLLDPDPELRRDVALHLARSGEDRWAAVLLKAFELAPPGERTAAIEALGVRGHASAVPLLADALRSPRDPTELVALVRALGHHRTDGAWRALTGLLDRLHTDDVFAAAVSGSLLALGRRDDIPDLVRRWRGWDPPRGRARPFVDAVTAWLGADPDILDRTSRLGALPLDAVLTLCARDRATGLPPAVTEALVAVWDDATFLRAVHRAVVQLLTARRDDVRAWMDASDLGAPAVDYRSLAIAVEALTGALAAVPSPEGHDERRLALVALLTLAGAEHAARSLRAATDPVATAWRLFRAPRPAVAPEVEGTLLLQRSRALPGLAELLASDAPDAVVVRAAQLVDRLHVAGVDASGLADVLTDVVLQRAGTPPAEAAADALVALGAAAVPPLTAALAAADDPPDELLSALGRLDCEDTVRALVDHLSASVVLDLRVATALADTGALDALDALAPAWSAGHPALAAMLEGLASMHTVDHPQRDGWRRDLELPSLRRTAFVES